MKLKSFYSENSAKEAHLAKSWRCFVYNYECVETRYWKMAESSQNCGKRYKVNIYVYPLLLKIHYIFNV